jgi:L-lactate dehydrogenase (cytochrome)
VVKAYAQGANFTFFGRILQFAIAAGGEEGLQELWNVMRSETSITMAQIGQTSLTPK